MKPLFKKNSEEFIDIFLYGKDIFPQKKCFLKSKQDIEFYQKLRFKNFGDTFDLIRKDSITSLINNFKKEYYAKYNLKGVVYNLPHNLENDFFLFSSYNLLKGMRDIDKKIRVVFSLGRKDHIIPVGKRYRDIKIKENGYITKRNIDTLADEGASFFSSVNCIYWGFAEVIPYMRYLLRNKRSNLYILIAPSGYGKSTLINELKYLSIKTLPKITTRSYRDYKEFYSGYVNSIPISEFEKLFSNGEILMCRMREGHYYGIKKYDFDNMDKNYDYITDSCDFYSAYKLRDKYPQIIKLVALFPSLELAGFGLEERIKNISAPNENFLSFQEELGVIKLNQNTLTNSKKRLGKITSEAKEFKNLLPYFDIILDNYQLQKNFITLLEKMSD